MTKKDDPFERIRISQRYSKKVTITIAKRFMPKTFMKGYHGENKNNTFLNRISQRYVKKVTITIAKRFMPKTFMKGYHGENKNNTFLNRISQRYVKKVIITIAKRLIPKTLKSRYVAHFPSRARPLAEPSQIAKYFLNRVS